MTYEDVKDFCYKNAIAIYGDYLSMILRFFKGKKEVQVPYREIDDSWDDVYEKLVNAFSEEVV